MSSLDFNELMSMSLPIMKLVNHFKHSFRGRDFDEFRDILITRENFFKKEIENLKSDLLKKKHVVTLLDRNGAPADLEKLLFEELLGKEQRKCQSLKETVIQLTEEKEKLTDHVKTVDKKRDMLFTENLKMENAKNILISELGKCKRKCQELEAAVTQLTDHVKMAEEINLNMESKKNNSIYELNEKVNELKNKNLESELLVGVYQEKCRCLDNKIAKMDQEMGQMRLESGKAVEELKLANKTIEDLRLKKIESDKATEAYKRKLENSSKMMKMTRVTNMNWGPPPMPALLPLPAQGLLPLPARGLLPLPAQGLLPFPAQGPVMGNMWDPPSMNHMGGQFSGQPPLVGGGSGGFRKGGVVVVCPYIQNGKCRKGSQCDYMHT